ncbi:MULTISPECIES: HAD family hydrolase [Halomonas]|uniref:HAD family hydrolase n=1 Tax=Halomonas TaxID=2745 RepID=UPI001C94EE0E|nr:MULTISPECIES: HAD family hydrolase [Halomonas]MBY6209050.1 haloacid dehalogenase-like hydrolase [Halomonas sp. DP3Y7-2]MBY6229205.1 haloacid dehalogenase-like hydrolase [Halomonas sp. DP3Y7-1]MCA0917732.1 haloacid dehalogenase-like hydrolase [Halomonas denitrificans]
MKLTHIRTFQLSALFFLFPTVVYADPLPSWNEGNNKEKIISFVESVSTFGSDEYVPENKRIAVFDNDGTLWGEQPLYFQIIFAMNRASQMPPEMLETDAQRAAAQGDSEGMLKGGQESLQEVFDLTHSGQTVGAFSEAVSDWLENSRHPETNLRYDDMIYQPMLELLSYLRDNEFETYIVSAGGLHFMRTFASKAYGIDPQNVIGSTTNTEVSDENGDLVISKTPGIGWYNDGNSKIIAIDRHIGQRPIIAGGNSDGDVPMMIWTTQGDGPRLGIMIHHTDSEREASYDRDSAIGGLDQGLKEAADREWALVDMANDWRVIYPSSDSQ